VDALLKGIKQPFSNRIRQVLETTGNPLLKKLSLRETSGKRAFHFWQQGPGYDRNLESPETVEAAINYIHLNPVRRGLVARAEQYKWSSCRYYENSERVRDDDLPSINSLPAEFWQGS